MRRIMITQKRILVTGGAGFLGTNLCKKLLDLGNEVIALDNLYTGLQSNVTHLSQYKNFSFIKHDITEKITGIDGNVDYIVNLACPASPPHYQKDPIFTTKTSVLGAINILDFALQHNAVVLQASTSEVYGDPSITPQHESYRGSVNPIGIRACYDEGKRCAESLFFDYQRMHHSKIKVIRIFNTYGPYMDPNDGRVVSNFIVQALQGKSLTLYGSGKQTRSFCFVDDLVDGIIAMLASEAAVTGPINLGNPNEFTLLELVATLEKVLGKAVNLEFLPLPADDPKQRCPDITQAKAVLNWNPQIQLAEGLAKTIPYFEAMLHMHSQEMSTPKHAAALNQI